MFVKAPGPEFRWELVGAEWLTLTSPSLFSWLSVSAASHTRDLPGLKGGDRRASGEGWAGIALQERSSSLSYSLSVSSLMPG